MQSLTFYHICILSQEATKNSTSFNLINQSTDLLNNNSNKQGCSARKRNAWDPGMGFP